MKKSKLKTLFVALLLITGQNIFAKGIIMCCRFDKWYCHYIEGGSCPGGNEGFGVSNSGITTYCDQLRVAPIKPPTIFHDGNGHAVLDNNGQITAIASDKLYNLMRDHIHDNDFSKQIEALNKYDDSKISLSRLRAISKDLSASIKIVKKIPAPNYCKACAMETKTTSPDTVKIHQRLLIGKSGKRCQSPGLYCYIKPTCPKPGNCFDDANLQADEIHAISTIKIMDSNTILITSIGQAGAITKETLERFKSKQVELRFEDFPNDYFSELFACIHLKNPTKKITFNSNAISYNVLNTSGESRPVQIIEIYQKTRITIQGKEYDLVIITTSAGGAGSAKNVRF
jgi:hypothetical protein